MNTFVATIDTSLSTRLTFDLKSQGFELSYPPHTLFSAKKKGISCTLYTSGKITVQGKDKGEWIELYLEPEILKTFTFSYPELAIDLTPHIGIDEAGKGDYFGPLCIAGVQANESIIQSLLKLGIKDSKQLSDKLIIELAKKIKLIAPFTIIRLYPKKYNELYDAFKNLNHLLAWGHATAIADLIEKTGCTKALIDQFSSQPLVALALKKKGLEIDLTQRTKAEDDPVVAAASILARAAFVEGIDLLGQKIGSELPKGAGPKILITGKHLVKQHGNACLSNLAKLHFKTTLEILTGF